MTQQLRRDLLRMALFLALAAKVCPQSVDAAKAGECIRVPFEYSSSRNSLLLHASVNGKAALLILDTGSAHTVLRPGLVGMKRPEVSLARKSSSGGGFAGDAVGKEVTLQVGDRVWPKYRVAVMDLSQILAVYAENPDGLLGLDFLQNYRHVAIDWRERKITLTL
jgi:Aspartyl protease